jgi:hypothetical protein
MLDYNKLLEIEDSFSTEKPISTKLREFKTTSHKKVRVRNQTRFISGTNENYN